MRPERLAQLKEWVSESTSADCSMSVVDKFGELFDAIDELAAALENKPCERCVVLEAENDYLRAQVGHSEKDCNYCGLGKLEQGKCANGFPGCARMDDQMLCGGIYDLADKASKIKELEAEVARLKSQLTPIIGEHWEGFDDAELGRCVKSVFTQLRMDKVLVSVSEMNFAQVCIAYAIELNLLNADNCSIDVNGLTLRGEPLGDYTVSFSRKSLTPDADANGGEGDKL